VADAYIYEAVRTPIGRRGGFLSRMRPDDMAGANLKALIEQADIDPAEVEDVVMGCVTQIGEQGWNIGRMAPLIAGFPVEVCGTTVNRMCGSSLQAVNFAAQSVMSGMHDLVIGAGVESMSRVAMGSDGGGLSEEVKDRFDIVPQGISAELICKKWGLTREGLDEFSLESHKRAIRAQDEGWFDREIAPIEYNGEVMTDDEGPRRDSDMAKLAKLKPAFKDDGVVTAASSSQISDGACAVLIGTKEAGERLGLEPRARFVSMALAGVDPTIMLTGPIPASRKAAEKAGVELDDIDLFEVNEAFAPVVMAWETETGVTHDKVNVNGGAVALGHPLGCSGARLLTTLLHEMERRDVKRGLSTLCIGFGQAVATVIER